MSAKPGNSRRTFLQTTTAFGTGLIVTGVAGVGQAAEQKAGDSQAPTEKVVPPEDLMREHGVIRRILLLYDEGVRRIDSKQDFDPNVFVSAAGIIRRFGENYHEQLEQNYIFPRFKKAGQLVDLVTVLLQQHQAGRYQTDRILQLATPTVFKDNDQRVQLREAMTLFSRMYKYHSAREDTMLFPAFHGLVTPQEYDALGEEFEKQEQALFGQDGFEKVVDSVASLEKRLGTYDLAQYTPPAKPAS